jgi:class 3 adenylate cyclase/tetratricopeptide (TPR) repeat protein
MQCSRCQHENPQHAKFCLECGGRLALTCAKCRAELPGSAKFCLECGTPVGPEPQARSPQSYTPKHLAERILTSKAALEGERKQVTVLFADLKGSMELLADRDPEEARKLLDPVLERMMEAVHRYEGTVNQVMGDGIMALFGAPLAHEDHAVRACYAALRMQDVVRRYSDDLRRAPGVEVQIRIGLNSGEVVVRSIGSDLHMDYTAVGQTTHLAARMEQLATPGSIRLTADTLRLAEGYVEVKPLGPVPVKGLVVPVEVYEAIGAGAVRSRLQAAAARGLTRFIGRDAEVEQLRKALEQARTEHGQLVATVGEPGVGKSRLLWEFTHSPRTHGWLILEASSVPHGKATPFLPVIDLLKGYFKIHDHDDQRKMRERIIGRLLGLDRALEPAIPAFLALLDVPVDDPHWQALDPPQRRQRTLDGIKRLLLRESQVQPLLVVIEDLQWIDSETQALLDGLIESLPTARMLTLVNYRPEYEHRWGSKTYYTQLRLDPLAPESADELLQALLGPDDSVQPLKRALIERTEGNPFFLEESVRTLVETQVVVGERGAYRLGKALEDFPVPTTVQAVLAARIDRLLPEDKRLLQVASVIGKDIPLALLQPIAELPEEGLHQALARLQAAEFLYETGLFPELGYTFKHALTHDVAYESLLRERRRALHARIVAAIEAADQSQLIEQAERLAYHAVRGELWDKAVVYLRRAGARAFQRSANHEARAWFDQALDALSRLPQTRELVEQAIDIRLEIRRSLFSLGEFTRIPDLLAQSKALAERLADERRLSRIFAHTTQYLTWVGDYRRAADCGGRAVAIATTQGDLGVQLIANAYLAAAHYNLAEWDQAIALLRTNLELLPDALRRERFGQQVHPVVYSLTYLAWCLAELGEFQEGSSVAEEGVRLAEELDTPFTRVVGYLGIGGLRLREGRFADATPPLELGLALCREWNLTYWIHWLTARLGYTYAFSGRIAEAQALLAGAVEHATSTGFMPGYSQSLVWLGDLSLASQRLTAARQAGESALANARRHGERGVEGWALRLLGEASSLGSGADRPAAAVHFRQAFALATELGMRPLVAHCHLGLAKLDHGTDKREQAKAHLTTAAAMYREMGMTYWLERARTELK